MADYHRPKPMQCILCMWGMMKDSTKARGEENLNFILTFKLVASGNGYYLGRYSYTTNSRNSTFHHCFIEEILTKYWQNTHSPGIVDAFMINIEWDTLQILSLYWQNLQHRPPIHWTHTGQIFTECWLNIDHTDTFRPNTGKSSNFTSIL